MLALSKAAYHGAANHYARVHSKRYPAYGKRLMEMRLAGQFPSQVFVVFEWDIARYFPRIVVAEKVPINDLELRYLAGLDVTLAYRDRDASRVLELAQAVLSVNPHIVNCLAMDIPENTILKNLAGEVML